VHLHRMNEPILPSLEAFLVLGNKDGGGTAEGNPVNRLDSKDMHILVMS